MTLQEFFKPYIDAGKLSLDVSEREFVAMAKKMRTFGGTNIDYAFDVNIGKDFDLYDYKKPDGSRRIIFEGSWKQVYKLLKANISDEEQITFW